MVAWVAGLPLLLLVVVGVPGWLYQDLAVKIVSTGDLDDQVIDSNNELEASKNCLHEPPLRSKS